MRRSIEISIREDSRQIREEKVSERGTFLSTERKLLIKSKIKLFVCRFLINASLII